MNQDVSSGHGVDARVASEETLVVATLLAFAGGYIDAYTWIMHRVFANAQTANMLFLWIHAAAGEWTSAFRYVAPLLAFVLGVMMACSLRRFAGHRAGAISLLTEIALLVAVAILHNRLPDLAGTLGISFVAAVQGASFPRVESWPYSSVMTTNNLRQTVEGLFDALAGAVAPWRFRRPVVFATICAAFGAGAATGAYATTEAPALALGVPVTLLLVALLHCEFREQELPANG